MNNCTDQNLAQRGTGFFRVPGLFVRLNKGLNAVDPDSVWSPTSPLDFKNLSSNTVNTTNLKPSGLLGIEADLKLRTSSPRVGLGLVDALTADGSSLHFGGKNLFLESIRPFLDLSLPKVSTDAPGQNTGSAGVAMNGVTAFPLCEDEEYTCVIQHGPNPRTTHILGGETVEVAKGVRSKRPIFSIEPINEQSWPSVSADGVASGLCSYCRRRLRQDRDTYMYLGEKAFCSNECRKCCIDEEIEEVEELRLVPMHRLAIASPRQLLPHSRPHSHPTLAPRCQCTGYTRAIVPTLAPVSPRVAPVSPGSRPPSRPAASPVRATRRAVAALPPGGGRLARR